MAIDNQAAVRGTHRTHHHAAGAGKGGAVAADDAAAATGFSALLGAAADDAGAPDTGLAAAIGLPGDALPAAALPVAASQAVPADDTTGADAAALAAWAGLLQPVAVPLAPVMPAMPAAGAAAVPATTTPVVSARTSDTSFAAGPAGAHPSAVAVPGAVAPMSPVLGAASAAASAAVSAAVSAPAPATISSENLTTAAAPALVLPAGPVAAPVVTHPAAPPMGTAAATPHAATLRPAPASTQSAAGRAHAATVAADAASGLSTGAIAVTGTDAGGATARGAGSTVSLGEGGQGRWAGVLSDIVRPMQAEAGAGGFSGGASQGGHARGGGNDGRGADGTAAGLPGFAPATASGDAGFTTASTTGGGTQPMAGGVVMTPDEWLAATTAPLGAGSLQTAELTVDTFGAPVDVKISLNGSEAAVAFQTDQADTRALLGGAVSDLQNLLQQEGLVLSGVSVGGSNAGQPGHTPGFDGDAGQGGKRARGADAARRMPDISVTAPVSAGAARSAAASARGGLDLFA